MNEKEINKVSNEYLDLLKNWNYLDNSKDLKLLSQIKSSNWSQHFLILSILIETCNEKRVSKWFRQIFEKYYGGYPSMMLSFWELNLWFIYKVFEKFNKNEINNIVYNLFMRWSITLKRNHKELDFYEYNNWIKFYSSKNHIFYDEDILSITKKWKQDYNMLLNNSDSKIIIDYKKQKEWKKEKWNMKFVSWKLEIKLDSSIKYITFFCDKKRVGSISLLQSDFWKFLEYCFENNIKSTNIKNIYNEIKLNKTEIDAEETFRKWKSNFISTNDIEKEDMDYLVHKIKGDKNSIILNYDIV
jgi:hypothetical protein